jgi:hypothetical protein
MTFLNFARSCRKSYVTGALVLLNAVTVLVLLNFTIALALAMRDYLHPDPNRVTGQIGQIDATPLA